MLLTLAKNDFSVAVSRLDACWPAAWLGSWCTAADWALFDDIYAFLQVDYYSALGNFSAWSILSYMAFRRSMLFQIIWTYLARHVALWFSTDSLILGGRYVRCVVPVFAVFMVFVHSCCAAFKQKFFSQRHFDLGAYRWLVRYIYIPLGGSRDRGHVRRMLNSMIPFAFILVWHGSSKNFVVWAALNWFGVFVEKLASDLYELELVRKFEVTSVFVVLPSTEAPCLCG